MSVPVGVLLMAYGGPDSLDDVPGYLADIRTGRPTPRAVVKEIEDHYRLIGGSSPLRAHSLRQLEALRARLNPAVYRCYLGMRHWSPWIEEVVGTMADEGITRAVGIVLAPHYSSMHTERYFQKVRVGQELYRASIEFAFVKSYHDSPHLLDALARRVAEALTCATTSRSFRGKKCGRSSACPSDSWPTTLRSSTTSTSRPRGGQKRSAFDWNGRLH